MDFMCKMAVFLYIFISSIYCHSQINYYANDWHPIGPNTAPKNTFQSADGGIGPIEFIRASKNKEGVLFAGSLSGGLFYSENGGDSWINSGSDKWTYSGCAWADFYPEDDNIWFAYSNYSGRNGKPGIIGEHGGILRSLDKGEHWTNIANYRMVGGRKNVRIFGTRFLPENPNVMFLLTSNGIYYTSNCLASYVNWKLVPNLHGWIYDMDFIGNDIYISNFFQNKWNILKFSNNDYTIYSKNRTLSKETKEIRTLTIEPIKGGLLIAKDYLKGQDEIVIYNPKLDSTRLLVGNRKISFGHGHTFAVSPYNAADFYLGHSTRVTNWIYPSMKKTKIGSGYHVDIEYIVYDPFDSLKIYFATHGGVFISMDKGKTWENKSDGLGVAEVMGMDVSPTDPNIIAIGCYHDGSMIRADFDKTGNYYWKKINGGDGLIPLIHPKDNAIVFTSNQYNGGGLFYSSDTGKTSKNIHSLNGLKSAGWETAVVYGANDSNTVYFNFMRKKGDGKGNTDICQTNTPVKRKSVEIISDFKTSHAIKTYKVYGLYKSIYYPNTLIAYILDYRTDEDGKRITNHRLFRTNRLNRSSETIKNSWYEIRHPNNKWIADVEINAFNENKIYISYDQGNNNPESILGDRGMVYYVSYRKRESPKIKRRIDLSKNIANSMAGRYNLCYVNSNGGKMIIGTRSGVYIGGRRTLLGKTRWRKIGRKLPHCKVYGIDYNEEKRIITVGLYGRGVWQYSLAEEENPI